MSKILRKKKSRNMFGYQIDRVKAPKLNVYSKVTGQSSYVLHTFTDPKFLYCTGTFATKLFKSSSLYELEKKIKRWMDTKKGSDSIEIINEKYMCDENVNNSDEERYVAVFRYTLLDVNDYYR